jgi:hypothetical protein
MTKIRYLGVPLSALANAAAAAAHPTAPDTRTLL